MKFSKKNFLLIIEKNGQFKMYLKSIIQTEFSNECTLNSTTEHLLFQSNLVKNVKLEFEFTTLTFCIV